MADYWAIDNLTGQTLAWTGITAATIAYSDETFYDGQTHRFLFPTNYGADKGYLLETNSNNSNFSLPDNVSKTAPRYEAKKRSIISMTDGTGLVHRIDRSRIAAGALLNINPDSIGATATYFARHRRTNRVLAWTGITAMSHDNEVVYDGRNYKDEFATLVSSNHGYVLKTDSGTTLFALPDSVSKTVPKNHARQRGVMKLTGPSSVEFRVWREEVLSTALLNVNPES
jgi:hypothetical protein